MIRGIRGRNDLNLFSDFEWRTRFSLIRANPFPEVTDLFCRLPLSTLFYQLEAVHLGDLLRL